MIIDVILVFKCNQLILFLLFYRVRLPRGDQEVGKLAQMCLLHLRVIETACKIEKTSYIFKLLLL